MALRANLGLVMEILAQWKVEALAFSVRVVHLR